MQKSITSYCPLKAKGRTEESEEKKNNGDLWSKLA